MKVKRGETRVRPLVWMPDHTTWRTRCLIIGDLMELRGRMFFPNEGSILLYWTQSSLRSSLRRVRSSARLYQALAERETDEAAREMYRLLAEQHRSRATRKLTSLFSLRVR